MLVGVEIGYIQNQSRKNKVVQKQGRVKTRLVINKVGMTRLKKQRQKKTIKKKTECFSELVIQTLFF